MNHLLPDKPTLIQRLTRGQASIGLLTAFAATTSVIFGWNAWNSVKTIALGEQTAAVLEWQEDTTEDLKNYQDKSDKKFDDQSEDITQLQIDTATTKEIVKLIGERYHINASLVEARVIHEVERREFGTTTSTTAQNIGTTTSTTAQNIGTTTSTTAQNNVN